MVRGRPRNFDRDAALEQAMLTFWANGYEATSLTDLLEAMGINPPSFYAAFGSKEALYREVIERYLTTVGKGSMQALAQTQGVHAAIAAMLRASVDIALASPSSGGCLVSLGLVNCQAQNAPLREHMRALRSQTTRLIAQRLRRAVAAGELPANTNVSRLARYFATIVQGISLQAQDGADRKALRGVVDVALMVLPADRGDGVRG